MDLREFVDELATDIQTEAESSLRSDREVFVNYVSDVLIEFGEISDFEYAYFEHTIKNKRILIDGYSFDAVQGELALLVAQYEGFTEESNLLKADIDKLAGQALNFVSFQETIRSDYEESSSAWTLADNLYYLWKNVKRVKIIVITDQSVSKTIKKIASDDYEDRTVNYSVWGIERLYEVSLSRNNRETTQIEFNKYGIKGLQAIQANIEKTSDYRAYMTIINGSVLADIYNDYGAALLEGNVRSFLMNRGKINRGIQATIVNNPNMFFAYNNGIAATASNIEYEETSGITMITKIDNLQIVNGGQTTASIFNVKHVEKKATAHNVFVPMKLSVISNEDDAEEIIQKISRHANTQNRVSAADFFSNSKFHRIIENISRNTIAPATDGAQFGTFWFYERARGQYNQEMLKMTVAQKKAFKLKNPKNQIITKTDLAKYYHSFKQRPDFVSQGAQNNFTKFADTIERSLPTQVHQYNKSFFIEMVTIGIIFKHLEKLVSNSDWYQNAFRANIVTYSIAYLFYLIETEYPNKVLNFNQIWFAQNVPEYLNYEFGPITLKIFKELTFEESSRTKNITEWAKKKEAWEAVKKNVNHKLSSETIRNLVDADAYLISKKEAKKEQKEIVAVNDQIEVVEYGAEFWKRVHYFGLKNKMISGVENDILKIASILKNDKVPSEKQSKILLDLLERLRNQGFN